MLVPETSAKKLTFSNKRRWYFAARREAQTEHRLARSIYDEKYSFSIPYKMNGLNGEPEVTYESHIQHGQLGGPQAVLRTYIDIPKELIRHGYRSDLEFVVNTRTHETLAAVSKTLMETSLGAEQRPKQMEIEADASMATLINFDVTNPELARLKIENLLLVRNRLLRLNPDFLMGQKLQTRMTNYSKEAGVSLIDAHQGKIPPVGHIELTPPDMQQTPRHPVQ